MYIKKIIILLSVLIINLCILGKSSWAANPPPDRPTNFTAGLPVYDKTADENTINLNWDASAGADFYVLQITSGTNWAGQIINQQIKVNGLSYTDIRQNSVSNPCTGTVYNYKLYAASYVLDSNGNPTADYVLSNTFSSVTLLTDPATSATSISTTDIKLKWDNVIYNGSSIDYEVQIFRDGVKVGQEEIKGSDIGTTVNLVNGKIEYTVTNLDKSTEYSFRLVPNLDANILKFNPYTLISGATKISAYLQKYNESIMKFIWDEYQGSVPSSDLYYKVIEIFQQNGSTIHKVIATPEVPYYYIQVKTDKSYSYSVQVLQKVDDKEIAESAEISLSEIVIPATPEAPNVQATPANNSISLQWDTPKKIDGSRDSLVTYDIWLLTDPNNIDNIRKFYLPAANGVEDNRISSNLQVINGASSDPNYFLINNNGQELYQYIIKNLNINTNYYIGVVAKKPFSMQDPEDQDLIISTTYVSEPLVMNIRTTSGNIEQPIALVQPLGVEVDTDNTGKSLITGSSVTLKWPLGETINGAFNQYYQSDVYFKVGYEIYTSSFDKSKTNDQSNPNYNIDTKNVTITEDSQTGHAIITGLSRNTQYVFWVKAYRDIPGDTTTKISEASDPIIVATLPDYTIPDIKPTVPTLSIIENTYSNKVILQFNSIKGVKYNISWGLGDNASQMTNSKEYDALSNMTPDMVTIDQLDPETTYYFRIQATYNGNSSEWSDSIAGRTIAIPPPDAPRGFGVKKTTVNGDLVPDIGEHYITLQWDKKDGVIYRIQIGKKDDFSDMEEIDAGSVSEYKVGQFQTQPLTSNTRYWMRLYAIDTATNKKSEYTAALTVKTKGNNDEYNSADDTETVLDTVNKNETIDGINGVWNYSITGSDADVLIEKIKKDDNMDYEIDLSVTSVSGINKREIQIPYRVVKSLSDLKQNMIIKTDKITLTLSPEWLKPETIASILPNDGEDIIIQFDINSYKDKYSNSNKEKSISDISDIEVSGIGKGEKQISQFTNKIKLDMKYTNNNYSGVISPYYSETGTDEWIQILNNNIDEKNSLMSFFYNKAGQFVVKKQMLVTGSTYDQEINDLLLQHDIKSVDSNDIRPTELITMGEAVTAMFDASNVTYSDNYMDIASKAGLLDLISNINQNRNLTKEEAVWMVMRLYEIRTGNKLSGTIISGQYLDADKVGGNYQVSMSNAIKMKIFLPVSNQIKPKDLITRGEFFALLNRLVTILENA